MELELHYPARADILYDLVVVHLPNDRYTKPQGWNKLLPTSCAMRKPKWTKNLVAAVSIVWEDKKTGNEK